MRYRSPEKPRFIKVKKSGLSLRNWLLLRALCMSGKITHFESGNDKLIVDMNDYEKFRSEHAQLLETKRR